MTNSSNTDQPHCGYAKMFSIFSEQCPDYPDSENREYYEALSPHEFHDAEELHAMRSQSSDTIQADSDPKQVWRIVGDIRQCIRVARVGFSQAPPSWTLSIANDIQARVREAA